MRTIKSAYDNEIYRQAFGVLIKDKEAHDFNNGDYVTHFPGYYRILVDGTYETEFSAETDEEAIQKFKDYFANKKKGITNSRKSIKSGLKETNSKKYIDFRDDMFNAIHKVFEKYNFQEDKENCAGKDDLMEVIKWMDDHYYFDDDSEEIESSRKSIKSSVRDDFAKGLQMIMKHEGVEFSNGTFEDNMVDIYDNYVSQFYEDELEEKGGVKVATDWFRNTYPDDEEGIFIHNSRKQIKSSLDYDDIDLAAAVAKAIPMASPYTQDAVEDWLIISIEPEDEGFESAEDITNFVYNYIDHFANDNWNDEESIRDLVNAGYLDDFWLEDFNEEIESACGSKGKKKKGKKEIKSSTESEILERGYKGHQVQHDEGAWILDQEKRFWSMSDLMQYVDERYNDEDEDEDDWDDEEIESSRKPIKSSYVDCFGEECKVVKPKFVDDNDLIFVDWVIDNDIVQYSVYRDDDDNYYAVEGEY